MNHSVGGLALFKKDADFETFEQTMREAFEHHPIRILSYCLMKNHFHLILWPRQEDELTNFMRWLTNTHTMRWHVAHKSVGTGHLYQGRFDSFPIQRNEHLLMACRYVERNPVRPGVVERAEDWQWGSLCRRKSGSPEQKAILSEWPVPRPTDWLKRVNKPETPKEFDAFKRSLVKRCPFGEVLWRDRLAVKLGLEHTLRAAGRPKVKRDK